MSAASSHRIVQILKTAQVQLLADWVKALKATAGPGAKNLISDPELQAQCQEFIVLLAGAIAGGHLDDVNSEGWAPTRDFLAGISRSRGRQGFSPSDTAMFVLSFKEPLFSHLRRAFEGQSDASLFNDIWEVSRVLDK